MRPLSLRSRLGLLAAAAVAVAVVAVSAFAWLVVRESLQQQLTDQLTADARILAEQPAREMVPSMTDPRADADPGGPPPRPNRRGWPREDGRNLISQWQYLDSDGSPRFTPYLPVTPASRMVAAGQETRALEIVRMQGYRYRMLTVRAADGGAVQVAVSAAPADRTLAQLGIVLALGSLAGIVGAALIGRTVARAGLAPVERLTRAAEHVAATQDLNAAITVRGADEIGRLAASFNAMLAALNASRAAQRMLVEDAGHELRTPLTSLRTNIELLAHADSPAAAGRTLPAEERRNLLRDVTAQLEELTQLTNELVQLARDEASPEPAEPLELADVVRAAVDRVRVRAPGVLFEADLVPVTVVGRPAALERAVLNILDNAAKWSPPAGTVDVHLTSVPADPGGPADSAPRPGRSKTIGELIAAENPEAGDNGRRDDESFPQRPVAPDTPSVAVLTVADAGPGIDEADRPKVFERFYRATTARSMPGSGLGLAIVAQTVAQHGGTIQVGRSAAGGALLTVRLPGFSSDS